MRKLRRVFLVVLTSAVLFELALQGIALAVWGMKRPHVPDVSGGTTVLCVGDSYTYGACASDADHSYPAVLQRLLTERLDQPLQVVNAGWPGQDSRDVLATLADRLAAVRPTVVCAFVGVNDEWNRPQPFARDAEERGGSFRWRFRTGRLVALALEGIGLFDPKVAPLQVAQAPSTAMVEVARQLVAAAGVVPEPGVVEWGARPPAVQAALEPGRAAAGRGDHLGALALVQPALAASTDEGALIGFAVECEAKLGRRDAAARRVDHLRRLHAAEASLASAENLMWALWTIGDLTELDRVLPPELARYPRAAALWTVRSLADFQTKDRGVALASARRLLELRQAIEPWNAAEVANFARLLAPDDPAAAARALAAAVLLHGSFQGHVAACYLIAAKSTLPKAAMGAVLEPEGLDERGRALLRAAFDEVYGGVGPRWHQVLAMHLAAIDERVTAAGARIVFANYPFANAQGTVLRQVATDRGAAFADVTARFDRELATRRREELFAPDGHCNDAGYAIVAEEFAAIVAPLLGTAGK